MRGKQAGKLNPQVRDLREVAYGRWRSEAGSTARGEVVPDGELPCVFVSSRLVSIWLVSSVVVVLEAWFFFYSEAASRSARRVAGLGEGGCSPIALVLRAHVRAAVFCPSSGCHRLLSKTQKPRRWWLQCLSTGGGGGVLGEEAETIIYFASSKSIPGQESKA